MGTTMPPVLESLQTVFPDISLQPLSHEAFSTTGGADHSPSSTLVHQDYSNRIGSINAKYSAAIDSTTQQQHYLEAQQRVALDTDEEVSAQADVDYTPGWRQAGLPVKSSHLVLDSLQVKAGGLVDPKSVESRYGAHHNKEVLSPLRVAEYNHVGADPHYCSTTSNLQVRNKLVPAKRRAEAGQGTTWRALPQEDLKARLAASAVRRKAMSHAMPKDQWILEKKIIDSMHHKLAFLRNPRFPSPEKRSSLLAKTAAAAESHSISVGSQGSSRHASPTKGSRLLPPLAPFRAEPSLVLFDSHEPGQQYHQLVTLHNTTCLGQRLRLLPPSSPYFTFSGLEFFQSPEQGMVAPGMHVGMTVSFHPDALHDYDDTMVVETGQGQLEVLLRGRRDPPVLDLPQQILVGPTLVANEQVLSITCRNTGGPGQFHICSDGQDPSSPSQDADDIVQLRPFQISPAAFALGRQEQMQLQFVFKPDDAGKHSESFVIKCNNGTQTAYQLSGTGASVQVQLGSLDGRHFTAEEEAQQAIWFGEVAVGATQHRTVHVCNPTPLPLPFCWQQTDEPASSGPQHAQHELTDGQFGTMQFRIEPAIGILEAASEVDMKLSFAPGSQHRYLSWAQLFVDTSVQGTLDVPCYSHRSCEVALEGRGAACAVSLWPPLIKCPGTVQVGQVVSEQLTVSNAGHAVTAVSWRSSNPAVEVQPADSSIAAGCEKQFQVQIRGLAVGQLQAQLLCLVEHGSCQAVEVAATVAGPAVLFEDPGLAFGLVQLGRQVSQQITIRNPSQHSSASWALHVLPQHAGHSEASNLNWAAQQTQHANPAVSGSLPETAAFEAQRAQQAQPDAAAGSMPAALRAKEQQLMQQLQQAEMTNQEVESEADASATAAAGNLAADKSSDNPFEGGKEEQGSDCRLCMKPDLGTLAPGASISVQVTLHAGKESNFEAVLELFTAGGAMSHLAVTASVVAPSLAITPTVLDLGVTHLGTPQECSLTLTNLTLLPTSFSWEAYRSGGVGPNGGELEVSIEPPEGLIMPGSQQSVHATFTPIAMGKAEALIACCTDSLIPPAGFSAVSHVKGLSVKYTVQPRPSANAPAAPSPAVSMSALARLGKAGNHQIAFGAEAVAEASIGQSAVAEGEEEMHRVVKADFGDCSIGDSKALLLSITNETPIAASVQLWLDTFQADLSGAAATAAAAGTKPHDMAVSRPILPYSSSGHPPQLTLPSLTAGMSAMGAQWSTPTLPMGSLTGAGVSLGGSGAHMGHKQHARRAGSVLGATHKTKHTVTALTLSSEAERSRPFASPLGQLMMTQRASQAAAKKVVGNRGIAIGVTPSEGLLPPGGVFTCLLTCCNDMCGNYVDLLRVQVGNLPEKKIPVHVNVSGTPLIMQLSKVLLPGMPQNPPAAQPLAQPLAKPQSRAPTALTSGPAARLLQRASDKLPPGMNLDFGQLLAGTEAERCFYVFNTASLPVQLDWTFYRYGMPGPHETRAMLQASSSLSLNWPAPCSKILTVNLTADETAQTVRLSMALNANPAAQPFVMTPRSAVIKGNGSAKFTVAFGNPDVMLHDGYLLGTQSIIAPDSRVKLHCTVNEETAPDNPDDENALAQSSAAAAVVSASANSHIAEMASARGDMHAALEGRKRSFEDTCQHPLVSCQLSGGFHPYAGPPAIPVQPLKVNLSAAVIQPCLDPEFSEAASSLNFVCHANHDPGTHPSYRQTVVLTNMHSCPLQFAVAVEGAEAAAAAGHFQIIRAACSSVSRLEGLQPKPLLAMLGSSRGTKKVLNSQGGSPDMLRLCPHEHVSVCVQYVPHQPPIARPATHPNASNAAAPSPSNYSVDAQSAGSATWQDESADAQIVVTYSNGQRQAVPVHAQRLHPVLQASTPELSFGRTHMQSPKTLQVELSNPSLVNAEWSVQLESSSEAGAVASVSFARGGLPGTGLSQGAMSGPTGLVTDRAALQQRPESSAAVVAIPSSGRLPGRGLTMPKTQNLDVTFAPKQVGPYTAVLRVLVAEGKMVEIVVSGEGTYTQNDECKARLQSI